MPEVPEGPKKRYEPVELRTEIREGFGEDSHLVEKVGAVLFHCAIPVNFGEIVGRIEEDRSPDNPVDDGVVRKALDFYEALGTIELCYDEGRFDEGGCLGWSLTEEGRRAIYDSRIVS